MAIQVSTRLYEFDHGRKPSGTGHWAFYFDKQLEIDQAFWVPGLQTYSAAKQAAIAEARKRGAWLVTVGS